MPGRPAQKVLEKDDIGHEIEDCPTEAESEDGLSKEFSFIMSLWDGILSAIRLRVSFRLLASKRTRRHLLKINFLKKQLVGHSEASSECTLYMNYLIVIY
jgi:hypothetical protein